MNEKGVTGKEMCEIIVEAYKKFDPDYSHTPEEIWNYSSRGELSEVFIRYDWAMVTLGRRKKSIYSGLYSQFIEKNYKEDEH